LLRPAAAPPAAAATDDGLALTSATTYTLVPEKSLVHVAIALTAKNTKPNLVQQTPNGTLTTRYFFESATIGVQPETTAVAASFGKQHLTTQLAPGRRLLAADGRAPRRPLFRRDGHGVGDVRPAGRRAAIGERDPRRVGVRDVLGLGVRRRRRRPGRRPGGYDVTATGSPTQKSVDAGITTVSATGIDDATDWYATIVADRKDALTSDRLDLPGGEHLVIRAWPEDAEWETRVTGLLRTGLPVLVDKLGLDWPVEGDIEVDEVHTPLLEGYAGIFHTDERLIEISEDLDELTDPPRGVARLVQREPVRRALDRRGPRRRVRLAGPRRGLERRAGPRPGLADRPGSRSGSTTGRSPAGSPTRRRRPARPTATRRRGPRSGPSSRTLARPACATSSARRAATRRRTSGRARPRR
jgi:hypothetical protein